MTSSENQKPTTNFRKVIAIVIIIIVIGIILYLLFGLGSNTRDDSVSLSEIENKAQEETVVLYFWGDGCIYCEQQKPVMEDIEDDYRGLNVTFYWLKYGNHNKITNHYNINGVPTTIVLNHSGRVKIFEGTSNYNSIALAIDEAIASYNLF